MSLIACDDSLCRLLLFFLFFSVLAAFRKHFASAAHREHHAALKKKGGASFVDGSPKESVREGEFKAKQKEAGRKDSSEAKNKKSDFAIQVLTAFISVVGDFIAAPH
jgi:hypothetical protein